MTTVFLDGRFLEPHDARMSAFDAGVQHGVGLFETMRAKLDGKMAVVFRLSDHLDRLIASAMELGLVSHLRKAALAEAVCQTAERAGHAHARLRLTITGGDLNMLAPDAPRKHDPTIMIVAQPATEYPVMMFELGVRAVVTDARANPLNPHEGHKTLNYWWRLRALQLAGTHNAAEALVFSITNHLVGGCVSNALLVKDGVLITPIARGEETRPQSSDDAPVLPSPVLPGITRRTLLEAAEELGIPAIRRAVTIDDLISADELVLTNSSWGVLPVVRVESRQIADARVGPISRRLREYWREHVGLADDV